MKKISLVMIGLFVLSLTSCSNDDDNNNPTTSADITGAWTVSDLHYDGSSTEESGGQSVTFNYTGDAIDLNDNNTITFNDDNSYTSEGDGYTLKLTTSFMGQETSQEFETGNFFGSGTWAKDGNTLTFTPENSSDENPSVDYHIDELSDSTLKLSVDDYSGGNLGTAGATINLNVTMTR